MTSTEIPSHLIPPLQQENKLEIQLEGGIVSDSCIIGDTTVTTASISSAVVTLSATAATPEVVVPPEEAVPCREEDNNDLDHDYVVDGESRKCMKKELDYPITMNCSPLEGKVATAAGNSKTGDDDDDDGSETQVLLRHMLQRLQQQELSIQQLQSTVQSQNNTLQTLMTTMQVGFAALLEKEKTATEPPLKRLISPERDHPTLGVANKEDGSTPDTTTVKDCIRGTAGQEITVKAADANNNNDKDMLQSDDNSITIHHLQTKQSANTTSTTTEKPALRMPHRASISSSTNHNYYESSLGMSALGMPAALGMPSCIPQKKNENESMLMPTLGLKSNGVAAAASAQQQPAHLPAFGKKSCSMLLDDDDDTDDDEDDDNSTIPSHEGPSAAAARISIGSCRVQLGKPSPKFDTVPSPPIYFPSPLNHKSANRMATRLSRATSAPLVNYSTRRLRGGGGKPELPKLPPRLPTREDSHSDGMDEGGGGGRSSSRRGSGLTYSQSQHGGNNINPNFFVPMPAIARAVSSPRLPTRRSFAKGEEVNEAVAAEIATALTAAEEAAVGAPDKLERKASNATTSTDSTMPRMPTRIDSVNKELDMLGLENGSKEHHNMLGPRTSISISTAAEDDIYLDGSTDEEQQQQQQQQQQQKTEQDTINKKRCMPRLPTRYESVSDGLDAPRLLGCIDVTDADDDTPVMVVMEEEEEGQPKTDSTGDDGKRRPLLDEHDGEVPSSSNLVGATLERQPSQSSISWCRFKQLAATSSQQTNATSYYCSEEAAVVTAGRQTPGRNSSRNSFLRSSLRGSRREIFAKQGLAHLHVSCVTLDSALVDEAQEWIGDDDETSFVDESGTDHHELLESGRGCVSCEREDDDDEGTHELVVVDSKKLADGSGDAGIYTGTIAITDNLPHGNGIMHYDNGKYYKGKWQHGNWHGTGQLLSANGDSYKGDFVQSTRHGQGVYAYDNGDTYDGTFNADKPHGMGVFKFADNSVYQGGFKFGSFDGQGWYEFDGGRYDGEWKGSCYDGHGTLQFGDGACYKGQFQAGKAHGRGEEVSAAGVSRKGQWKHGDFIKQEEY